jgi:hypothetical protein
LRAGSSPTKSHSVYERWISVSPANSKSLSIHMRTTPRRIGNRLILSTCTSTLGVSSGLLSVFPCHSLSSRCQVQLPIVGIQRPEFRQEQLYHPKGHCNEPAPQDIFPATHQRFICRYLILDRYLEERVGHSTPICLLRRRLPQYAFCVVTLYHQLLTILLSSLCQGGSYPPQLQHTFCHRGTPHCNCWHDESR